MRTFALLALVACSFPEKRFVGNSSDGGTDGASADGAGTADATPDALHTCYVPDMYAALTLGSSSSPPAGNWFFVQNQGPLAGKTIFGIAAAFNQDMPPDGIQLEVVKPAAGFATGTPYAFDTVPSETFSARAALIGDYDATQFTWKQYLFASNGSITFSAIGESNGSQITGSVTVTSFREVDEMTGADVPGGCTSQIAGMQFYIQQQN